MASLKSIHVVLLCMMFTAPTLTLAQVTCRQVVISLTPCVNYVLKGGNVPTNCCSGVKTLYGAATTTASRQSICQCLRSALSSYSYNNNNVKNAQSLPAKCGVNIPNGYAYKITPQTKCSDIP